MTGTDGGADPGTRPGWRWDVALSFAGAQRGYVEQVAEELWAQGVRCFYDADEQLELWGSPGPKNCPPSTVVGTGWFLLRYRGSGTIPAELVVKQSSRCDPDLVHLCRHWHRWTYVDPAIMPTAQASIAGSLVTVGFWLFTA